MIVLYNTSYEVIWFAANNLI